jgi:hypothetical protein
MLNEINPLLDKIKFLIDKFDQFIQNKQIDPNMIQHNQSVLFAFLSNLPNLEYRNLIEEINEDDLELIKEQIDPSSPNILLNKIFMDAKIKLNLIENQPKSAEVSTQKMLTIEILDNLLTGLKFYTQKQSHCADKKVITDGILFYDGTFAKESEVMQASKFNSIKNQLSNKLAKISTLDTEVIMPMFVLCNGHISSLVLHKKPNETPVAYYYDSFGELPNKLLTQFFEDNGINAHVVSQKESQTDSVSCGALAFQNLLKFTEHLLYEGSVKNLEYLITPQDDNSIGIINMCTDQDIGLRCNFEDLVDLLYADKLDTSEAERVYRDEQENLRTITELFFCKNNGLINNLVLNSKNSEDAIDSLMRIFGDNFEVAYLHLCEDAQKKIIDFDFSIN